MTMRVLTGDRVTLDPLDRATAHAIDKNRRDGQRWAPDFPADGDVVIARVSASDPGRHVARRFAARAVATALAG